ncbi:MAG: hypothetical protein RJA70_2698 [Pseudomonadota bacterium]|jgi:putative nucleotidyltransferase with HDIG domain
MTISVEIPLSIQSLLPRFERPSETELLLVEKLNGGRAALPMLPSVASNALELANDPDAHARSFAELIETDPPMAARFLSVANSALYARGRRVASVGEAVTRVGMLASRDLIFQIVYAAGNHGLPRFQSEVQSCFQRSVLAGLLCRAACNVLRLPFREAYLCGLLHDIGEARVYRILCEVAPGVDPAEAASLVLRYHPRAGAELAEKWQLPSEIVEACRKHHLDRAPVSDSLLLVRAADLAVPCVEALQNNKNYDLPSAALEVLALEAEAFVRIVQEGRDLADRAGQ